VVGGDTNDRRSALPARLELSLRNNSIASSFYCRQDELHANADPPPGEAVDGYQQAVELASAGVDSGRGNCIRMRQAILACLPAELSALLKRLTQGLSGGPLVELEIVINDRRLENYPWELLAEPGLLTPPEVDVAVWRGVSLPPAERQASTAVLLIGSASLDLIPPFSHEEVGHLAQLLGAYPWIKPLPYPSITFGDFANVLDVIHPVVVHLVVHGSTDGFQFQASRTLPEDHYDIPAQELAGRIAKSAASVVVLNACDSATASADSDPFARHICLAAKTTAIGMAAQLPANIAIVFAEQFYRHLALGARVIDAYRHAVHTIRAISGFANLWSVPVMYSTRPNLVIFPTDPSSRARLGFNEVSGHLEKLEAEIDNLVGYQDWTAGDWAENTAASAVRIAYVRDVLVTLTTTLEERRADLLHTLPLRQGCDDLRSSLEELSVRLRRLTDPSSSRHERARTFDGMTDCQASIRHTLWRITRMFAEMP
jgi:hypothetical protein